MKSAVVITLALASLLGCKRAPTSMEAKREKAIEQVLTPSEGSEGKTITTIGGDQPEARTRPTLPPLAPEPAAAPSTTIVVVPPTPAPAPAAVPTTPAPTMPAPTTPAPSDAPVAANTPLANDDNPAVGVTVPATDHPELGPVDAQVRAALLADRDVGAEAAQLQVTLENNRIVLRGQVSTSRIHDRIKSIADRVAGLGQVDDELRVPL